MIFSVTPMEPAELDRIRILPDAGLGALHTDRGNLPLDRLDVQAGISGLVARTTVTAEYVNTHNTVLEATYIFPLPDRAAVTGMTMTADGRTVVAQLQERAAAREVYDRAVESGQRASIAEEERPDVFSMRVGNILPGERVTVALSLVGPLPWEDGAATFRFPLVVAPRYVPGAPLPGPSVGDGQASDTDAVPDASRISPPVLLPGFPNPLRLSVGVDIDPAGLPLGEVRSSLHTVTTTEGRVEIAPGERADRDFILRLPYAGDGSGAVYVPDAPEADGPRPAGEETADGQPAGLQTAGDETAGSETTIRETAGTGRASSDRASEPEGTYQMVLLPPDAAAGSSRPKDVILLLDRSGSMGGWKMVAARRAAARVIDTLTPADRFAVFTFDHQIDYPEELGNGLSEAADRQRFRAVEHLARVDARGGTELLAPLRLGLGLLADPVPAGRDRVLVLVTDGQVGNEDQILNAITPLIRNTRVHTVGIDRAVNAGFLGRLAALGAGRCELVESEDRLDEAMEQIHRRIGAPVLTDVVVSGPGVTPGRPQAVFPGVPLVVFGRYTGTGGGALSVRGRDRADQEFAVQIPLERRAEPAVTAQWARARLRELEDRYAAGETALEQEIVATSLRFGVLCRFTSYVAVDSRVVNEGGQRRRVTQPVESPSGWEMFSNVVRVSAAPMPPPSVAPMRTAFAPVQMEQRAFDELAQDTVSTKSIRTTQFRPGAPAGGGASGRPGRAGAAPARSAPAGRPPVQPAPAGGAPARPAPAGLDLRAIVEVEARRLREAEGRSAVERRDLLADLASRLGVLLAGAPGAEYEPLRRLVEKLTAPGGDLAENWALARTTLEAFGTATGQEASAQPQAPEPQAPEPPARKAFWKR